MAEANGYALDASEAIALLRTHAVMAPHLARMTPDQLGAFARLQADLFIVIEQATALADEAKEASGDAAPEPRRPRPGALSPR